MVITSLYLLSKVSKKQSFLGIKESFIFDTPIAHYGSNSANKWNNLQKRTGELESVVAHDKTPKIGKACSE